MVLLYCNTCAKRKREEDDNDLSSFLGEMNMNFDDTYTGPLLSDFDTKPKRNKYGITTKNTIGEEKAARRREQIAAASKNSRAKRKKELEDLRNEVSRLQLLLFQNHPSEIDYNQLQLDFEQLKKRSFGITI